MEDLKTKYPKTYSFRIRNARDCDRLMSYYLKKADRYQEKLDKLSGKYNRFKSGAEKTILKKKEVEAQLVALQNNLSTLEDESIKNLHNEKLEALNLRLRALQNSHHLHSENEITNLAYEIEDASIALALLNSIQEELKKRKEEYEKQV